MRILIWILLGYLVYRMLRAKRTPELPKEDTATETFQDPVCGVFIPESDAVVGRLDGKKIHFCSMACLERYQKELANDNKNNTRREE
ncbi:eL24 family ribosomal protein [Geomesophilobacter sediminis]|uniref:Transcriptional regulator n=1 Tax=Geomesophilobacter sediminis TaxID=2798584 RepID=A0A8J7S8W1_9BACT|nr:transcriptional regulator [Geomesophilobacter sediminis]MBJ6727886.1 transcriptional regulator [Geomesophilobacter sediminis]